jgi:hypothetical protein
MLLSVQTPCLDTHVLPGFVGVMRLYCSAGDSQYHGIRKHYLNHMHACCMHLAMLVCQHRFVEGVLKETDLPRVMLHVNNLTCI